MAGDGQDCRVQGLDKLLIYLVLGFIWTFQCHKRFSVGVYILTNIMNRCSISGNNTEQVLQSQIIDLQSNIVVTGTNLGVGSNVLTQLTTGTDNVAIGLGASSGNYSLTTCSGNVMLGANSGGGCVTGSNNTLLGYNTSMSASYILGSIALGTGTKITGYNQLMVAPNVTQFNILGLATS
jgi:hypothetical protein